MSQLRFRNAKEHDLAFIIDTWMIYGRKLDRNSYMSNADYKTYYKHAIIRKLKASTITVLYSETEPDYIIGYCVHSLAYTGNLVVHFIYVRREVQRMHMATRLIGYATPKASADLPLITTSHFRDFAALKKKYPRLTYNPFVPLISAQKDEKP